MAEVKVRTSAGLPTTFSEQLRNTCISLEELQQMDFPPVDFVVPRILPVGCNIMAGMAKLGKTYLLLDIAAAITTGGYWGILDSGAPDEGRCQQGSVLYLALEETAERIRRRMQPILEDYGVPVGEWPADMHISPMENLWPRFDKGGLKLMTEWLEKAHNPRMVVIDTHGLFEAEQDGKASMYTNAYKSIHPLCELAHKYRVAIVIVMHLRKESGRDGEDFFEKVTGSLGNSGAADATLGLAQNKGIVTLVGRGRDLERFETVLEFNAESCRWKPQLGDAEQMREAKATAAVLKVLLEAVDWMRPADIAAVTGKKTNAVRQILHRLKPAGRVKWQGDTYAHPENVDVLKKVKPQAK